MHDKMGMSGAHAVVLILLHAGTFFPEPSRKFPGNSLGRLDDERLPSWRSGRCVAPMPVWTDSCEGVARSMFDLTAIQVPLCARLRGACCEQHSPVLLL